ncbi:MAG: response regulator, partial [Chloroflexi bacterium]|nr:response regulator [Chloroflexota bacterium]
MAGEKILFADSELEMRKFFSDYLRDRNYRVTTATDGLEALRVLRYYVPDIVIADADMPYVNGLELARLLRTNHRTAHVPIIMLSPHKEVD